jgi:UDP-glucuronate decarboxylase
MKRTDIGKARQHLGWEPHVPLKQGLTETINYFKKLMTVGDATAVQ